MALRYLLPPKVRLDLKERSHYICIDPDQAEDKDMTKKVYEMQF